MTKRKKMKKVKIFGNEYEMKPFSYRALFMFEELTQKSVSDMTSMKDRVTYLFCILSASNESFNYEFDEFLDELEKDEKSFATLSEEAFKEKK